jgi:putative transposase
LGGDVEARRVRYRALCKEALSEEIIERIRTATHLAWPIGSDEFCAEVELLTGRRAKPAARGRPPRQIALPGASQVEIRV